MSVKKLDYFLRSVDNGNYLKRRWLLMVTGIIDEQSIKEAKDDLDLTFVDGKLACISDSDGTPKIIEDHDPLTPLFPVNEKFTIPVGTLGLVSEAMETTYGILIANTFLVYYPYRGKIPYVNGKFDTKALDAKAYSLLKNKEVTIKEHLRYENAASFITCLSQVVIPTASRKSITPNPKVIALRDQLLKENKDRLDDPAVVAAIQKQISDLDKAEMEGDSSNGFFTKPADYEVKRLRTYGMYGAEPDFQDDTKIKLMTPSLSEGWDVDNMEMLVNKLRSGSYSRGHQTALGGESTKITTRIFQNFKVNGDDCGSKIGMDLVVNSETKKVLIGRTLVGNKKVLDSGDVDSLVGTTVQVRSPLYCKQPGTELCEVCIGINIAEGGIGLNSQAVTATSAFMNIFMGAVHSRAVTTARYNFKNRIS